MANFRAFLLQSLPLCALLVTSCAPAQPPEDPDSANVDPSARDSSGQSYAEAIATVCDADRLAGADPNDPLQAARLRDEYLVEHVKNADGIYFLTLFRSKAGSDQVDSLAREAKAAKVARCPLIDTLRASNAGLPDGEEAAIRALVSSGIAVKAITDVTPLPHNGCRPRKKRRV